MRRSKKRSNSQLESVSALAANYAGKSEVISSEVENFPHIVASKQQNEPSSGGTKYRYMCSFYRSF
jgi:hypothetical protein